MNANNKIFRSFRKLVISFSFLLIIGVSKGQQHTYLNDTLKNFSISVTRDYTWPDGIQMSIIYRDLHFHETYFMSKDTIVHNDSFFTDVDGQVHVLSRHFLCDSNGVSVAVDYTCYKNRLKNGYNFRYVRTKDSLVKFENAYYVDDVPQGVQTVYSYPNSISRAEGKYGKYKLDIKREEGIVFVVSQYGDTLRSFKDATYSSTFYGSFMHIAIPMFPICSKRGVWKYFNDQGELVRKEFYGRKGRRIYVKNYITKIDWKQPYACIITPTEDELEYYRKARKERMEMKSKSNIKTDDK